MPTYDYHCKECGHTFDEFQSINADPLLVCPQCARPALRRILSGGTGMIFKGSGFYLTDYKKSSNEGKETAPPKDKSKPKKDPKSES
jgi:putative FmdB family regulatory protein